ncbi:ferritin-like domain-containing protein [Angustibacter sp. McL0619]|uniref:ferritin-like domain-containing protein n=1 Tax=Angustibacter sp. McL0619 TaxID=3415676 RepID=UPI003CE969D4
MTTTSDARRHQQSLPVPATARPHDLHWIRGALQSAIAIEHATMPLYSAAMYSLEVQNYPAYNTLRSVLMEEMLHMAAMCNALAAVGGRPRIRSLDPSAVLHGLPGLVTGLRARLAPLSRRQLEVFMSIEGPDELSPPPADDRVGYASIGAFYRAIREAVEKNAAAVAAACRGRQHANQVGGNLGYRVVRPTGDPVEQILASIDLVIDQGEGAGGSTRSAGPPSDEELSHYARFAELRYGRGYTGPAAHEAAGPGRRSEGQRRWFRGPSLSWPRVINTLAVPRDGYRALLAVDPRRGEVEPRLRQFDEAYTRMLAALDDAWNGPPEEGWPALGRAVLEMNELRVISCFEIVRQQVPGDVVGRITELYPQEAMELGALTDLSAPVYYGPRFENRGL